MKTSLLNYFIFCSIFLIPFSACHTSSDLSQSEPQSEPQRNSQEVRLSDSFDTFRSALRANPKITVRGDYAYHNSRAGELSPSSRMAFSINGQLFSLRTIESGAVISFDEIQSIKLLNVTSAYTLYGTCRAWYGVIEIIPVQENHLARV